MLFRSSPSSYEISLTAAGSNAGLVTNYAYANTATQDGSESPAPSSSTITNCATSNCSNASIHLLLTPTLSITNSPQVYTGSQKTATVTCSSGGAVSNIQYAASSTAPTNIGTYAVTADCAANGNYAALTAASAGNFVISSAAVPTPISNTALLTIAGLLAATGWWALERQRQRV